MRGSVLKAIAAVGAREKMRYALNKVSVSPGKADGTIFIDATDGRACVRFVEYGKIDGPHLLPVSHADRILPKDECTFTDAGLSVVTDYSKPLVLPYDDDGNFPNVEMLLADIAKTKPDTAPKPMLVDPQFLGRMAALAEALNAKFVHVEWVGGTAPMLWKSTPDAGWSFVLMPASEDTPDEVRKDAVQAGVLPKSLKPTPAPGKGE